MPGCLIHLFPPFFEPGHSDVPGARYVSAGGRPTPVPGQVQAAVGGPEKRDLAEAKKRLDDAVKASDEATSRRLRGGVVMVAVSLMLLGFVFQLIGACRLAQRSRPGFIERNDLTITEHNIVDVRSP